METAAVSDAKAVDPFRSTATVRSKMTDRTIPQRELRNNIAAVLRAAEAGETFTVTVRGRPVARVLPLGEPGLPRVDVDRETIARILAQPYDETLAAELDAVEEPVDDPWPAV